eukprot:GEZU01010708.1.p1 GENE.GEZU01010708.1~~GEZU01010708.1.p1  ORF type:complete len:504 (+),score=138.48 GEZU01010708.1:35-1546(+)
MTQELRNMRAGLLATDDINIPMIGAKQQDLDNVRDKLNLEQYRFAQYIVNSSVPRPAAVNLESLVRTHTFKRKITHMLAHQFLDFFDVDTPKSSLKRYPDHPLVVSISPTINVANTVGYAIFDAEKPEDPFVTLINENPSINIKNDQCQIAADLLSGAFAKARAYEGTGDVITVPLVSLRGRYVSFWRADFPRRQLEEIAEGKLPADRAFLRYYEGVKRARDRVGLDLGNPAERKLAVKNFIALLRTYQANPGPVPGPKQQQQQQEQQQQQQPVNSSTTAGTTTTTDSANTTTTAGPTPTPVSSVDRVSIVSLNCIIDACAEINDLDRALATFSEISSVFGLEPDINTYNGLLESCARTRQISTAFRIYELLCKSASNGTCAPPNAETCRILVTTCIRSNNLERALDVLDECMRNGIRPTQATFIALIRYAVRSGGTDLVQKLEELMLQFGYDPVDHLQHYIDQYSDPASDHTHQRKQQQQYYRPQEEAEAEVAVEDDEEASN